LNRYEVDSDGTKKLKTPVEVSRDLVLQFVDGKL
jgi:hypothetical protein